MAGRGARAGLIGDLSQDWTWTLEEKVEPTSVCQLVQKVHGEQHDQVLRGEVMNFLVCLLQQ